MLGKWRPALGWMGGSARQALPRCCLFVVVVVIITALIYFVCVVKGHLVRVRSLLLPCGFLGIELRPSGLVLGVFTH